MFTSNRRPTKYGCPIKSAVHTTLEDLEARKVLSADPLTIGTLKIGSAVWLNVLGTENDNIISITQTSKTAYTIGWGASSVVKTGTFAGVRIAAGAGNDLIGINGVWATRTSIAGEAGDDTIIGGLGSDSVLGGAGDDSIVGQGGVDYLFGELGNDTLSGGAGADVLNGGAGDDSLDGGADNDNLSGVDGNDTLSGGQGNDAMNGGVGADSMTGGDGNDNMAGVDGDDTLSGDFGNDTLSGGVGDDFLNGGADNDLLVGLEGNDTLIGGLGNDSMLGGVGDDSMLGDAGNDTLAGEAGNDSIDAGANDDKIIAGLDLGNDTYAGGTGLDQLDFTGRVAAMTITLDNQANDGSVGEADNVGNFETLIGGNGADFITGNASENVIYGGTGNDTIIGDDGDDKIYGGVGLDSLSGGLGDDSIYGQNDNDRMFGDEGEDLLEGGLGNDAFFGGDGRDRLIAIGGGVLDSLLGGDGLDSFWMDFDATELSLDLDADETAARAEHRVKSFVNAGKVAVSKEIAGQNLAEPVGVGKLVNYKNNKLFSDFGPTAADISQGQAGDCWFLSTLSAIAKVSAETIRQSVTDLGDGTYAVRFSGNANVDQFVRVDADLYTYTWSTSVQSYATSGIQGSIWAPILEKALTWVRGSKLGNYATISSGWMSEASTRLGIGSVSSSPSAVGSVNGMVTWLQTQLDANKAVTIGTPGVQAGVRLVGGHAYMVDHLTDNNDGTYSVTLRNPWGVDGVGSDNANDGYVTITMAQLYANCSGMSAAA